MFCLAFCNDCDLMSWEGYLGVHKVLDDLGLHSNDSFWLFDPSGGDMGLFTHNIEHKGPCHNKILDEILSGRLNILHSSGSYGARFNKGFKPSRTQTAFALDYLQKYAKVPQIWTNHGDEHNIQNIGGNAPCRHHCGDDHNSEFYILDLLVERGIKYFCNDKALIRDATSPYRLLTTETCRNQVKILTFRRYLNADIRWAPNAQNLHMQISKGEIETFSNQGQNAIIYSHWGCHHDDKYAFTPTTNPLTEDSIKALEQLAAMQANGIVKVTTLSDLLAYEEGKSFSSEVSRCAKYVVATEQVKRDNFYFNQYHKHGIEYFEKRINQLGIKGKSAFDAGCGVGQWSFALANCFNSVVGMDQNETAFELLSEITRRVNQETPKFFKGSIEDLSQFEDSSFDFVFCSGVIMFTKIKQVLSEFRRVMTPGGTAYICLNGDGFNEHCIDVRFKNDPEMQIAMCVALWHAFYFRLGGKEGLKIVSAYQLTKSIVNNKLTDKNAVELFDHIASKLNEPVKTYVTHYSKRIKILLMHFLISYLKQEESSLITTASKSSAMLNKLYGIFGLCVPPHLTKNTNTHEAIHKHINIDPEYAQLTIMPDEFAELSRMHGFSLVTWAPEGKLIAECATTSVPPIYDGNYNGQVGVYEVILKVDPLS